MQKNLLLLLLSFSFTNYSPAQVLCVKCYNQNARVLNYSNDLVMNGGFENSTCDIYHDSWPDTSFCPNSNSYHCDVANWTCTGGGINTYADICDKFFTTIIEGSKAVYFGSQFCHTCSFSLGDTSCIKNIGCEVSGIPAGYPFNTAAFGGATGVSLGQTVNGLTPGSNYTLEFWSGGEWENNNFNYKGLFAVDVGLGNILLRNPPTRPSSGIGKRYVVVFTATSSSHTIKFTSWGHICSTCTELILDDVRLFQSNVEGDPCALATDALNQSANMTVFPNPTIIQTTITTNSTSPSEITLYDITSRKLLQQKFTGSISLNTESFSRGIYIYEVKSENGETQQGRLIRE